MARTKWAGGVFSRDEAALEKWLLHRVLPFDGPDYPDPHFHRREDESVFSDEHLFTVPLPHVWEASEPAVPQFQYDVRQMIQTLVGGFSLALRTAHLEWRVGALESESRELREILRPRLEGDAIEVGKISEIDSVMAATETVTDAAEQAFGVRPSPVTIVVSPPGAERPFTMILDFGKSPEGVVSKARGTGARRLFYETIITSLRKQILDLTDFEFVFP